MRVMDISGRVLDAEYAVEAEPGQALVSLVLESSSGSSKNRASRNVDYRPALKVLLSRLKDRSAILVEGLVDSRVTRSMPEDQRRLFTAPIHLTTIDDLESLRVRLCTAQSSIGQAPGASKGGNATKRIRLRLAIPGYTLADAAKLETDLAFPAFATTSSGWEGPADEIDPTVPSSHPHTLIPDPQSRLGGGAGYLTDPVLRKAIEEHAVRCAMTCYPDYDITDVGATESFDLLAVKNDEELHIEVKGSTGTADTVELTTNEVHHARSVRTALVVVDQITYERLEDNIIRTSGGRIRRWTNWQPAEEDLQPTRYRYRLPKSLTAKEPELPRIDPAEA